MLINLCCPLELLHNHLCIVLLLHHRMTIFSLLVLLVPTPFVHLGLRESCGLGNAAASLLGPVGVFRVLLHQILHLVWIFPISLFSTFVVHILLHHLAVVITVLRLLVGNLVVGSLSWWSHLIHLAAHLVVILWAKLPNLWTGCWLLIFVILVSA